MKTNTDPLFPERYYHIYNRGINGQDLFKEEKNYSYFLQKYFKFVLPVANIFAYCLLKNHFHILLRVRTETEIREHCRDRVKEANVMPIEKLISKAFNSFFKSYSATINTTYHRTGRLFEEPFLRIPVNDNAYLTTLIMYIHTNAEKHGFVDDFSDYPFSSYRIHLSDDPTELERKDVIDWFGGRDTFERMHQTYGLGGRELDHYFL